MSLVLHACAWVSLLEKVCLQQAARARVLIFVCNFVRLQAAVSRTSRLHRAHTKQALLKPLNHRKPLTPLCSWADKLADVKEFRAVAPGDGCEDPDIVGSYELTPEQMQYFNRSLNEARQVISWLNKKACMHLGVMACICIYIMACTQRELLLLLQPNRAAHRAGQNLFYVVLISDVPRGKACQPKERRPALQQNFGTC